MNQSHCRTFKDVLDLLSDFKVELIHEENKVFIEFPDDKELDGYKGNGPSSVDVDKVNEHELRYGKDSFNKPALDGDHHLKLVSRTTIRSLISNGRFWRLTTVTDQLFCYFKWYSEFGLAKVTKKMKEPVTIHFDSQENAIKFFGMCINN